MPPSDPRLLELRAVAISRASGLEPHVFPLPPTASVSAWQAVMRASQLRQRGRLR
jgi:hypothetical protein